MPPIRQYNNPIQGLSPNSRGAEAAVAAGRAEGRGIADLGAGFGSAVSVLGEAWTAEKTKQEISQGLSTSAELQSNMTTAWNNVAKEADPNNPALADEWRENELKPMLDAWESSFTTEAGKKWAQSQAASMRNHFFEKTAADQSTLAGVAAVANVESFKANASNTAMQDPSAIPSLLGAADSVVDVLIANNPNLTVDQIAKMRSSLKPQLRAEIVKSGFVGMARANPDAAIAAFDAGYGATDLDGTERNSLRAYAESVKKGNEIDARAAAAADKVRLKAEGDAFMTKAYAQGIQPDGSWVAPPGYARAIQEAAISNPEAFSRAEVESALAVAEKATRQQIERTLQQDDPTTYDALNRALNNPGPDLKLQINQAYLDGMLSDKSRTVMLSAVDDAKSNPAMGRVNERMNEMFAGLKSTITKSNPFAAEVYPRQDQKYYEFQAMVRQTVDWAIKKQGMSPDEAAFTYLDPRGPKYLGTLIPARPGWAGYQLSDEELGVEFKREGNAGVAAPTVLGVEAKRRPGETVADYLKRTGG